MSDCILVDFDGTITARDTTRYLLRELLLLRPWRIFLILPNIINLIFLRDEYEIQKAKNSAIGIIINGLTPKSLESAIDQFSKKVQPLIRPEIIKIIHERAASGFIVIVLTASPDFAVYHALKGQPIKVIGTSFKTKEGRYFYSNDVGIGCYGKYKPIFIKEWISTNGIQPNFSEAWSDTESDLPMMMLADRRYWVVQKKNIRRIREIDPTGYVVKI
jgi:HAD superfamily phosphoserine phosphatase-like hydrolase